MDFAVHEPPASWQTSRAELIEIMRRLQCFTPESITFMSKLLDKSGTGDHTHWPPGTTRLLRDATLGSDRSLAAARAVAETVLCSCFEQVLARTGERGHVGLPILRNTFRPVRRPGRDGGLQPGRAGPHGERGGHHRGGDDPGSQRHGHMDGGN